MSDCRQGHSAFGTELGGGTQASPALVTEVHGVGTPCCLDAMFFQGQIRSGQNATPWDEP